MCIVPALRFPEFTGEWERHKLSEVCSFYSGGTPSSSKKEYYNGNIPFIRSGELHKDYTELFITEAGLSNSAAKLVETGDLLLALYGATSGDIAISKIKGAINQAILCIRTKQNKKFIESVWNKHVERLLQTYLQGGQGNLSADIVKNIPFYFANSNEQDKLAKFISLLDERIATQNKIIEDLKKLMSAISLLLFSECFANDKLVPLKSISNSIKRKNDGQIHPIMMISAEHGFINQSEKYDKDNAGNSLSNYTLLYKGELSYNRGSSKSKKFGSVFSLLIQSALVPHVYHSFCMDESVADCTFYSLLLNSRLLDKELVKVVSSTARMDGLLNISKEDFFSIKVPLPCIDKQRSITNILQKINIKIKREKNIQSLLCLQRKYLLSQMFI